MSAILRKIYVNIDVRGKRYDIWLFEELSLYMKAQVIENHRVVLCRDLPGLYEYFYFRGRYGTIRSIGKSWIRKR